MASPAQAPARLRPATPGDEGFLRDVYASTREDELALTGWSAEQKAAFCTQQHQAQDVSYRSNYLGAEFLIIDRDGEPVGRLYRQRREGVLHLLDLALLPAHRHAGLGTSLVREMQAVAAREGRLLSICVERFNPALAWYLRLGFQACGELGMHLQLEWRAAVNGLEGATR